jgi:hypothetical protein
MDWYAKEYCVCDEVRWKRPVYFDRKECELMARILEEYRETPFINRHKTSVIIAIERKARAFRSWAAK